MKPFAVTSDAELVRAARDKTSYSADELPGDETSGQVLGLVQDAKRVLYTRTGSDDWYSEVAYGQALVALLAMKFKSAVENVNIESYGIGDEDVSFSDTDPETSQQLRSWSSEVTDALRESDVAFEDPDVFLDNTASYIG